MGINPDYYWKDGISCYTIIEVMTSDCVGDEAFYLGNIIKYLFRYKEKGGTDDLRKAATYLDIFIGKQTSSTSKD